MNKGYIIPPGIILLDYINQNSITLSELSEKTGFPELELQKMLTGLTPLTEQHAKKFDEVLHISASFWLETEKDYRKHQYEGL